MEFLELVKKRFSLRNYSNKRIERKDIEKCLEAVRLAPSADNSQPWYFIIVDKEKEKNELADIAFSGVYSMNSFAKSAPVLVVVLDNSKNIIARAAGVMRSVKFSLIDIGIGVEHFVLQAEELGIGTCWLGWFNEKGVKKYLNIPRTKRVVTMLAMGYPPEEYIIKEKKRKRIDEIRTYFEKEK